MSEKKAEDFRKAAIERGIERWPMHKCSICGYQCAYLFNWADTEVAYDAGCHCSPRTPEVRSWEDVARHYKMQTALSVILDYDEFWGFKTPLGEETPHV
jgi:hypothetical protein